MSETKDGNENIIYTHQGPYKMEAAFAIIMGISIFAMVFFISNSLFSIIILPFFFYLGWHSFFNYKNAYSIYDDRIEFFNENSPRKKEVINNADIVQVRFEDEFGKGYESLNITRWIIYAYLKDDHTYQYKRIKNNRVWLQVNNKDKVESLITILSFYQKQKKEIYLLTKLKKINKALNLKNWNNP